MENVVILENYQGSDPVKRKIVKGINDLKLKGKLSFDSLGADYKLEQLPRLSLEDLKRVLDMTKSGIMIPDIDFEIMQVIDIVVYYNIHDKNELVYILKDHIVWSEKYFKAVKDLDKFGGSINYKLWLYLDMPITEKQVKTALKNKWLKPFELNRLKLNSDQVYSPSFIKKYMKHLFTNNTNRNIVSGRALKLFEADYIGANIELFNAIIILASDISEVETKNKYIKLYSDLVLTKRYVVDFSIYRLDRFINNLAALYECGMLHEWQLIAIGYILPAHLVPYAMAKIVMIPKNKIQFINKWADYIIKISPFSDLLLHLVFGVDNVMYQYTKKYTVKQLFGNITKFEIESDTDVIRDSSDAKLSDLAADISYPDGNFIEFDKKQLYNISDIITLTKKKNYKLRYEIYIKLLKNIKSISPSLLINNESKHISDML